jgi:hypothetical protein
VLQLVLDKQHAVDNAQNAVEMHKRVARAKHAEALKNAWTKFSAFPNHLTAPELKVLFIATTNASESPAKSKKADLTAQLYHEPRYSRVQALWNNLCLSLAAERKKQVLLLLRLCLPLLLPPLLSFQCLILLLL